ncbi:UDP-N-acetylmuramate dehydrogenase [Spiractinospora alimapuensis]|uniref:UDP-N-acetylmuramate dehydrogenase n=1 Tax=Spiractinospora alimapuensis TaxID=2820884 RepID=UPI001EEA5E53|nr:UDP-N-acetylmuramate dehydrogenase [Spiractinospora alimapuensis]QVQ51020.1 UDP-N-acetylmuramate dehydrogenase [Spiractinospora alimapuensis]
MSDATRPDDATANIRREATANVPLAEHTTLRLGGPARRFVTARDTESLIAAVRAAEASEDPLLVLGGGSNLVVSDSGFPGTVVSVASTGIAVREDGDRTRVRVAAGEEWDPFVRWCVTEGLSGVESLSGIPGRVGATPIQNVGAYGQEVSETLVEVVAYDRDTGERRTLTNAECGFAYRDSVFKRSGRFVVCEVVFSLRRSPLSQPIAYAELARALDVEVGAQADLGKVRESVLRLRRGKGMVIDPDDPDSHSAGSFFTNPILSADAFAALRATVQRTLGPDVAPPAFPLEDGRVKTSAAWLIDRAGFAKGHALGPARISTKHTLALTNPGAATTADLLALARHVRDGVAERFGVTLVPEPVLVNTQF